MYEKYRRETGDTHHTVIASTASAYKFPQSVLNALGEEMQGDGFALAARLAEKTGTSIPAPIASLQEKSVRFTDVTAVSGMREAVRRLAGI